MSPLAPVRFLSILPCCKRAAPSQIIMSGGFFRGTSLDQDARFGNKQKKLMAKMKFPPCFDQKVYSSQRSSPRSTHHILRHCHTSIALASHSHSRLPLQVTMKKVQFETLKPWIATKLTDLLGTEDEILINLAIGLFEDPPLSVSRIDHSCRAPSSASRASPCPCPAGCHARSRVPCRSPIVRA